tara:strand:- start:93 stop:659 length:567 start_codon:yes stop_codon:yes gene_type:complete
MRVISGKFKGTKLKNPSNFKIRPTTDRIKETVFSMIESQKYSSSIFGKYFLDLFSGSGSIGIEAFSRGAQNVYMIENNYYSLELIKQNILKLNLSKEEKNKMILIRQNVLELGKLNLPTFNFIYIDPPYIMDKYKEILSLIIESKIINNDSLIILETKTNHKVFHESFFIIKTKKFSNCYLNILKINS